MPGRSFGRGNKRASRLTGEDVLTIRERYAMERGCTQARLAREFQVTVGTIANIVNRLTWQNISGDDGAPIEPPPLNPRPKGPKDLEASMAKMQRLLDNMPGAPKAPYSDPPPEGPGEEPLGIGMARLFREAENLQPQVGNELGKLEKGD